MQRRSPTYLLVATFVFATFGFSGLPAPLDGQWQQERSRSVMGRDIPITIVFDLSTTENGNVSGELVMTIKVSEAVPGQDDQVRRFRVDGQYDHPGFTLEAYNEDDELAGEYDGRISEDGRTLLIESEENDEPSEFAKVE